MGLNSTEWLDTQTPLAETAKAFDPIADDPFSFDRSTTFAFNKYFYIPTSPQKTTLSASVRLLVEIPINRARLADIKEILDQVKDAIWILSLSDKASISSQQRSEPAARLVERSILPGAPFIAGSLPFVIEKKKKKKKGKDLWSKEEDKE